MGGHPSPVTKNTRGERSGVSERGRTDTRPTRDELRQIMMLMSGKEQARERRGGAAMASGERASSTLHPTTQHPCSPRGEGPAITRQHVTTRAEYRQVAAECRLPAQYLPHDTCSTTPQCRVLAPGHAGPCCASGALLVAKGVLLVLPSLPCDAHPKHDPPTSSRIVSRISQRIMRSFTI